MSQREAYERFAALHERGCFVLANAWDAASAVVLREAGMPALGTSSAAIAFALGRADGAHAVSRNEAIANGTLLARASGLPVNVLIGPWSGFVPISDLEAAGVRRVSLGGALYGNVMGHLARVAERIAAGEPGAAPEGRTRLNFNDLFG